MRLQLFVIPVAALIAIASASAQSSQPVSIPIFNPRFLEDQLTCSPGPTCYLYNVTGWVCGPGTLMLKLSTAEYENAPPEGLYVAGLGATTSFVTTGSILQTLGDTLQADKTYVLRVTVGAREDAPFTGYRASLMAGNVVLASGNSATPVGGTFITDSITYNSGANPAQLGKPLQVFVKSVGTGSADVAAVTLTVQ